MGRSRRGYPRAALTALMALPLILAACSHLRFFPRIAAEGDGTKLLGQATGRLVLDQGCLWLESVDQPRDLLIWGPTYGYTSNGWSTEITRDGALVAKVGEEISVSGGEFSRGETQPPVDDWIESQIGQAIPPACRLGTYWVVQ